MYSDNMLHKSTIISQVDTKLWGGCLYCRQPPSNRQCKKD